MTPLSYVILSSHFVWRFLETIGISQIPHCYGNLVAIVTKRYLNTSFVLSLIEFIFDMEVPKDDKH